MKDMDERITFKEFWGRLDKMKGKKKLKKERNIEIRNKFIKLRESMGTGEAIDMLADEFKMQFDNIRAIVYKGGIKNLKLHINNSTQ